MRPEQEEFLGRLRYATNGHGRCKRFAADAGIGRTTLNDFRAGYYGPSPHMMALLEPVVDAYAAQAPGPTEETRERMRNAALVRWCRHARETS